MIWAVIGIACLALAAVGVCVLLYDAWTIRLPEPPPERPSRTVRVIRDPRFDLERHDHDRRVDDE